MENKQIREEFLKNTENLPVMIEDVDEFFKKNPDSLYGEDVYPETILELDPNKIADWWLSKLDLAYTKGVKDSMVVVDKEFGERRYLYGLMQVFTNLKVRLQVLIKEK